MDGVYPAQLSLRFGPSFLLIHSSLALLDRLTQKIGNRSSDYCVRAVTPLREKTSGDRGRECRRRLLPRKQDHLDLPGIEGRRHDQFTFKVAAPHRHRIVSASRCVMFWPGIAVIGDYLGMLHSAIRWNETAPNTWNFNQSSCRSSKRNAQLKFLLATLLLSGLLLMSAAKGSTFSGFGSAAVVHRSTTTRCRLRV